MDIPKELELPYDKVEARIEEGIKRYIDEYKIDRAIIGISGGLDSSVTAYLTSRAIGSDKVVGVTMNDTVTPEKDRIDARRVFEELRIRHLDVDITSIGSSLTELLNEKLFLNFSPGELRKLSEQKIRNTYSNIKPRLRMTILYFFANRLNGSVIGTSDKSEILLGYFTKYGDGAADILPIGDLKKTQVRALGSYLGLPESILSKKSSPALLPNQTAEGELGVDYKTADLIFHYGFDQKLTKEEVVEKLNIAPSVVENVYERVRMAEHKRSMPPIIKI